jgi:hypothetical protein
MKIGLLCSLALTLTQPAYGCELWGTGPMAGGSVRVTYDGEFRYHRAGLPNPGRMIARQPSQLFPDMPVHDYFEHVQRLNLLAINKGWTVGLQIDQVGLFSNRYMLDGEEQHSWPLYNEGVLSPWDDALAVVEKMYVRRNTDHWEVTVGDAYASFGRGMALNIVKNTDIDVDTSIRGAKIVARSGDMDFTVISGLTNQQQISLFYPNLGIGPDVAHMVTGARLERFGALGGGVHAVIYKFARALETAEGSPMVRYEEDLDAAIFGANLSLTDVLGLDVYVEGDLYDYRSVEMQGAEKDPTGYASYASVAAYPGKAVVLLEVKKSKNSERLTTFTTVEGWEPATVPTLEYERVITEDSAAAIDSNDIQGARVRVDYALTPGKLTPYAAFAYLEDEDTGGLHFNLVPERIMHPVTGVEWANDGYSVQLNTGHRIDQRTDFLFGSDRMTHLDATIHLPLFGEESLEIDLSAMRFEWGVNTIGSDTSLQQEPFAETSNALVWHHGERWVFVAYQDWSDNPLLRSTGNLGFVNEDLYGALEAQWSPTTAMTVKAFYGAYKAGIRCSGGQCRQLPGFNGARLGFSGAF